VEILDVQELLEVIAKLEPSPDLVDAFTVSPEVMEFLRNTYARPTIKTDVSLMGVPVFIDPNLDPGDWHVGRPHPVGYNPARSGEPYCNRVNSEYCKNQCLERNTPLGCFCLY
jgi:hypothetical protein